MKLLKRNTSKKKAIKKATKAAVKNAKSKGAKKAIREAGKGLLKTAKKSIKKENKAKRKIAGEKMLSGLRKIGGKASGIPFAALLPFKKVMTDALDKRAIKHTNDLSNIAPRFVQHIIKNSYQTPNDDSYYENGANMLTMAPFYADAKSVAQSVGSTTKGTGLIGIGANVATGNIAGAATGLVSEILNYIRKLKDKKDKAKVQQEAGQPVEDPLTDAEKEIISQSEKVGENLKDAVKEEAENSVAFSVKNFIFSWKGGVAAVALIGLVVFAIKKK